MTPHHFPIHTLTFRPSPLSATRHPLGSPSALPTCSSVHTLDPGSLARTRSSRVPGGTTISASGWAAQKAAHLAATSCSVSAGSLVFAVLCVVAPDKLDPALDGTLAISTTATQREDDLGQVLRGPLPVDTGHREPKQSDP